MMKKDIRIEYPCKHVTFTEDEVGVFEYSRYPRGSVLAGRTRRVYRESFQTVAEAIAKYPNASIEYGAEERLAAGDPHCGW